MPEISVIMPICNTLPNHLKKAIESILTQSYTNFEFIILNDSPDNKALKDIVTSYQDPRIKYLENEKTLGIAKSYNRLLEEAKSPYIALMNHDDISLSSRLYQQHAYLTNHKDVALVGTAYKKFGEINRFKTITPPQKDAVIKALLLFKSPVHHPTIMLRKSIIDKYHIRYDESYISLNDRKLCYDISKVAQLANLSTPLYKYRFHKEMTSKKKKPEIIAEKKRFHAYWFMENNINLTPAEKEAFDEYVTLGRCRIKDAETLSNIKDVLERLAKENKQHHFAPEPEFSDICAKYLVKRCLNAALYGKIASKDVLDTTSLPVHANMWLNIFNLALSWRA